MVNTDTDLQIRNLTIDYTSGHVLIDGRPIGTFMAEQGPEVLASPVEDLYIVNVPMMVKGVTFLPSGQTFERQWTGLIESFRKLADRVIGPSGPRVTVEDVRLALAQALPADDAARRRVLDLLDTKHTHEAEHALADALSEERDDDDEAAE